MVAGTGICIREWCMFSMQNKAKHAGSDRDLTNLLLKMVRIGGRVRLVQKQMSDVWEGPVAGQ